MIIEDLINNIAKLPSLGNKSARRIVLDLLTNKEKKLLPIINSLEKAAAKIQICQICGNLGEEDICQICQNPQRQNNIICVVEEIADLWALEKSAIFKGKYHILGGALSAINGKGPEDLNIESLLHRIEKEKIEEVILATNSTIEGQSTAFYLSDLLQNFDIKISKLTTGIPVGSELDYLDEGTLEIAFNTRKEF